MKADIGDYIISVIDLLIYSLALISVHKTSVVSSIHMRIVSRFICSAKGCVQAFHKVPA